MSGSAWRRAAAGMEGSGRGEAAGPAGGARPCPALCSAAGAAAAGLEREGGAGAGRGAHRKKHKKHKKKHKKRHHREGPAAEMAPPGPAKPQLKLKIRLGGQVLGTKRYGTAPHPRGDLGSRRWAGHGWAQPAVPGQGVPQALPFLTARCGGVGVGLTGRPPGVGSFIGGVWPASGAKVQASNLSGTWETHWQSVQLSKQTCSSACSSGASLGDRICAVEAC